MLTEMHAHVLYGLDDGAQTEEDMLHMLEMAEAGGTKRIYCTTHIAPGEDRFDPAAYDARLAEAREKTKIELYSGAEIYYTEDTPRLLKKGSVPSYDGSRAILTEFAPDEKAAYIEDALSRLTGDGWIPVLAHVERTRCLMKRAALERLKEKYGVCVQVNSETIMNDGAGFFFRRRLRAFIESGLVDFVSSDAHDVLRRPFCLKYARHWLAKNFDESLADRLCGENFEVLMNRAKS